MTYRYWSEKLSFKKALIGLVSIWIVAVGGCASTRDDKSTSATHTSTAEKKGAKVKEAKALTPKDIFARYRMAVYGKDGIRKHTSTTVKGTVSIEQFGVEGPFTAHSMAPNSSASVIELMGMKIGNGCHKEVCWSQVPGGGTMVLSGDAAAMQLQQSDYYQWDHMERYYTSMEIEAPVDGKESLNYRIKAVKKNGDTDYYEFSKETGLLTASIFEGTTAQGHMKVAMQFKNYKDFDGTLTATEVTQSTPQATIKLTFSDVSYAPLSEDKFAKPD